MLRLSTAKDRLERRALSTCITRSTDAVHDNLLLQLRFLIIAFEATERGNDCLAFFIAFASEEPARGFGEPDHTQDEDEGEDDLKRDWETPREVWGAIACAVVNLVGD